jgi:hypothetical protein
MSGPDVDSDSVALHRYAVIAEALPDRLTRDRLRRRGSGQRVVDSAMLGVSAMRRRV